MDCTSSYSPPVRESVVVIGSKKRQWKGGGGGSKGMMNCKSKRRRRRAINKIRMVNGMRRGRRCIIRWKAMDKNGGQSEERGVNV